jgi:hypothetical protein
MGAHGLMLSAAFVEELIDLLQPIHETKGLWVEVWLAAFSFCLSHVLLVPQAGQEPEAQARGVSLLSLSLLPREWSALYYHWSISGYRIASAV